MIRDGRLRAEVAKVAGYLAGLNAATPETPDLERRLTFEIVAATLRAAFDSRASDSEGTSANLLMHYQRARDIRSRVVAE